MKTTAGSTIELEQRIRAALPDDAAYIFGLDNELQRRRASDKAQAANARQSVTDRKTAQVNAAILRHKPQLDRMPQRERTDWLHIQMEIEWREGDPPIPDKRFVRSILRAAVENNTLVQHVPKRGKASPKL